MSFKGISEKTKDLFLSHITSPSALIFPVKKEICAIAREEGVLLQLLMGHMFLLN